jgi:hypothetical protein
LKPNHSRSSFIGILILLFSISATAQQLIKVSQSAWLELTSTERELIQKKHIVELLEQDAFGVILDNQGVNESTNGTTIGANLGGSIANAAYIDNAIKGGNYSAKNQLAVGIIGAIVGSTLDRRPNAQYRYRYAVKLNSGNIKYVDEVTSDPFRHPIGICVSVPSIALIDQQLCTQTVVILRSMFLDAPPIKISVLQVPEPLTSSTNTTLPIATDMSTLQPLINCKLGTLAPVRTSAEKCELIKGNQVQ